MCVVCTLALILGTAAIALMPADQVLANGPHVRSREVFAGTAGPYQVKVLTAPVVGTMHLSIQVTRLAGIVPVGDAKLQASGTGPGGTSTAVGPLEATAAFGNPGWYGVNLPINEAGTWRFTLAVQGPPGVAQVEFPVFVQPRGGISLVFIGGLVASLAIAAWWALVLMRGKRRSPNPHRPGQEKR